MGWSILAFNGLDGVCASAIVQRLAVLKERTATTRFVTYQEFSKTLASTPVGNSEVLFILDLSPSEIQNMLRTVNHLRGNKVYWNTHHKITGETKELLQSAGIILENRQGISSAAMVAEKFMPEDGISKELARIAADREFWKRLDYRSEKLADLISSGKDLAKLSASLSKGIFWTPEWESEYVAYKEKKREALCAMLGRIAIKRLSKWYVGFVLAETFINSADAGQFILDQHSTVDIVVVLFRSGRISFRRRDSCDVDVSKFAKVFGGGGHPYASGGVLNTKVSLQNFNDVVFDIDQKMRKAYSV